MTTVWLVYECPYFYWQDDPEAHEKFVRINRAYEVLKDGDLRKVYDLHGEKGLDGGGWVYVFIFLMTYHNGCIYERWKEHKKIQV